MGNYGIKISKPGSDVSNAGLEDLLFTSKYPLLKIKDKGTGSISITDGAGTSDDLIVTHNLGYEPIFRVISQWVDLNTTSKQSTYIDTPYYDGTFADLGLHLNLKTYVDTSDLRYEYSLSDSSSGNSYTLNYKYVVYYDPDDNP